MSGLFKGVGTQQDPIRISCGEMSRFKEASVRLDSMIGQANSEGQWETANRHHQAFLNEFPWAGRDRFVKIDDEMTKLEEDLRWKGSQIFSRICS